MAGRSFTVQKVGQELANAMEIRAALASQDDPQLIIDMIEGSTSLHEAICVIYEENIEDEAMVSAIDKMISDLDTRKSRLQRAIEGRGNIILMAMERAEIQTIKGPVATLTAKATPPKVEIEDESLIPSKFWKVSDPTLDKRLINETVKGGEDVPGTRKSNGGICLQIKRG